MNIPKNLFKPFVPPFAKKPDSINQQQKKYPGLIRRKLLVLNKQSNNQKVPPLSKPLINSFPKQKSPEKKQSIPLKISPDKFPFKQQTQNFPTSNTPIKSKKTPPKTPQQNLPNQKQNKFQTPKQQNPTIQQPLQTLPENQQQIQTESTSLKRKSSLFSITDKTIFKSFLNSNSSLKSAYTKQKQKLYYNVIYKKKSQRRGKPSSQDGILVLSNQKFQLQNSEGKPIMEIPNRNNCRKLQQGQFLSLRFFQVQVLQRIHKQDYLTGRCFLKHLSEVVQTFVPLLPSSSKIFDIPQNAYILDLQNKVYIQPSLSQRLRPHQQIGVQFMYDCLSGKRGESISGCILADSMGLGKTLQTITLLHTMLRKNAQYRRIASRAIIVAPASLLNNWKNQFTK